MGKVIQLELFRVTAADPPWRDNRDAMEYPFLSLQKKRTRPIRYARDEVALSVHAPAAEIAEKQARSIKYQLTIAKLPLAKDIDDFRFDGTPINEALVRELATGAFIPLQRNVVLIGGTGTGKSQVSTATPGSGPRGRAAGDVCLNEVIADRARQSVRRLPGYSVGASQVEQGVKT